VQPADEEAVDTDQLARTLGLHVPLRLWLARRLVGGAVAGDERQPLRAPVEAVPAQAAPDAVGRDDDPAPPLTPELAADPPWPEAGMGERERDDPLLDKRRELVGHPRPAPLARAQHLQAVAIDLAFPVVERRAVHPERAAGCRDADPAREVEQLQPIAEEHVILRHATPPFAWR